MIPIERDRDILIPPNALLDCLRILFAPQQCLPARQMLRLVEVAPSDQR